MTRKRRTAEQREAICNNCGEVLVSKHALVRYRKRGYGFCSRACTAQFNGAKRAKDIADRFWPKVNRRGDDECWPWIAKAKTHWGYGRLHVAGKVMHANRIAFELANGPIPEGMLVCHSCDNPGCCNPAHLWLGTTRDNTRDMDKKGRRVSTPMRGEKHPCAKLTASDALYIRNSREDDRALARRFDVTHQQIQNIKSGRQWRCLDVGASR